MSETMLYRRELTSRLVNATEDIAWIIRGLGRDHAAYSPAPGEWSIHEHLAHLRDMEEQVYLPLLRWATVPDMLDPRAYNRRDWHEERYDPDEPILGKTGTCTDRNSPTHMGWFGSFNDVEKNKLVVVVMLTGGKHVNVPVASGVAGEIYRKLSGQQYFGHERHTSPAQLVHSACCLQ